MERVTQKLDQMSFSNKQSNSDLLETSFDFKYLNSNKPPSQTQVIEVNSRLFNLAVHSACDLLEKQDNKSVKTPVSLMQEICTKLFIASPVYETISTEMQQGRAHEPVFIYQVSMADLVAAAKGSSKKKAKHAAALELFNILKIKCVDVNKDLADKLDLIINTLKTINTESTVKKTDLTISSNVKKSESTLLDNTNSTSTNNETIIIDEKYNPVGDLLEITQKYSLRPPEFEFDNEQGPAHAPQFVCRVKFGEIQESGIGKSKKAAKRQAAFKLLENLKTAQAGDLKSLETINPLNIFLKVDKQHRQPRSSTSSFALFKNSQNPMIGQLLTGKLEEKDMNKSFLEKLALEERFDFKFYKTQSLNNQHKVILQIKTNPIVCFHGYGKNTDEALENASYHALDCIKLLCGR